jgi:hypothetical protein
MILTVILLLSADVLCQTDTSAPNSTNDPNGTVVPTNATDTIAPSSQASPTPSAAPTQIATPTPTQSSFMPLPRSSVCYGLRDTNSFPMTVYLTAAQQFGINKVLDTQFKLMALSPPVPCLLAIKTVLCAFMLPAVQMNGNPLPLLPSRQLCTTMQTACEGVESPRHLLERRKLVQVWETMAADEKLAPIFNMTGILGILGDCSSTISGLNGTLMGAVKAWMLKLTQGSQLKSAASNGTIPAVNFLTYPAFPNTSVGTVGELNLSVATNLTLFRPCPEPEKFFPTESACEFRCDALGLVDPYVRRPLLRPIRWLLRNCVGRCGSFRGGSVWSSQRFRSRRHRS